MSESFRYQCFALAEKASLERLLTQLEAKTTIYFGKTTEEFRYTDHGCFVERLEDDLYSYIVAGHGIGSSEKTPANLKATVRRIFSDCQQYSRADTVTIELAGH